tara:strand:+ start:468 stop:728 length:261 start_codon:yes stop_codon:yes gene_type:complete
MDRKDNFGSLLGQDFNIGDIVEWTTFDKIQQEWLTNYGIITTINKEITSGRLISVSKVVPINGIQPEIKFFTASLKLVSRTSDLND